MAVRTFTADDTSQIWSLLNELGSEVNRTQTTLLKGFRIACGVYQLDLGTAAVQQGSIQFGTTFASPPPVIIGTQATGGISPLKVGFNIDPTNATTTNCRIGLWNSTGAAVHTYRIAWLALGAA